MTFNKGDKVRISDGESIWNEYIGTVMKFDDEAIQVKIPFSADETGETKYIIQIFDIDKVVKEGTNEALTEKIQEKKGTQMKKEDYIKNYLYQQTLDGKFVPSWIFADRIAAAENISSDRVIQDALEYKHKVFVILGPNFEKTIVANQECSKDDIEKEYADFLLGKVFVEELK